MSRGLGIMNSLAKMLGKKESNEEEEQERKPASLPGLEKSVANTDPVMRKKIQDAFNKKLGK